MQVLVQVQMDSYFERQSVAYVTGSLDRLGFKSWLFPAQTGGLIMFWEVGRITPLHSKQLVVKMLSNYPGRDSNPQPLS